MIAEAAVAGIYWLLIRKIIRVPNLSRQLIHAVLGSGVMLLWLLFVKSWSAALWIRLAAGIFGGMGIYAAVLLVLRDTVAMEYVEMAFKILRR